MNEEEQQEEQLSITPEGEAEIIPVVAEAPTQPSRAEVAAYQAGQVAGRAGSGIGRLLGGVGERIETGRSEDDLSDLFEGPDMERDNDVYTKDLTDVSEEDVFGEGGADMSDLLEVDEEVEEPEPENHLPIRKPKYKPTRQQPLPGGLTGLRI